MRFPTFLAVAAVTGLLAAGPALAADKAAQQAEIRKMAQTTLNDFYKADAKIKGEVSKAAGYAVFSTYGLSFLVGGAGGKGLAHNAKTGSNVYMSLAQASAGIQLGASETRYLFVFNDAKALQGFIDSGWEAGAGASAGAGMGKDSVGAGGGVGAFTGGKMYALTKAGLQAGGAVAGTKVWKDKDLN